MRKIRGSAQCLRNILKNIFVNKNICILGIDGTGKSSIVKELCKVLGNQVETEYMGSKNYITKLANKRLTNEQENKNWISKLTWLTAGLYEMWYRVIRHWPSDKKVIYDRYSWERYITLQGTYRIIGHILYKVLFPKPKFIFYLHCPTELSFCRKSDILDREVFRKQKAIFDAEYLEKKHIIAINTAENDIDFVVSIILKTACRNNGNTAI